MIFSLDTSFGIVASSSRISPWNVSRMHGGLFLLDGFVKLFICFFVAGCLLAVS
jgi:hypothetical protein